MSLFIIDGYNLIHKIPKLEAIARKSLSEGRTELCMMLEDYGACTGNYVLVVFDGTSRRISDDNRERFAGVDVLFSSKGISADKFIIKEISNLKHHYIDNLGISLPITVVSDDRELRSDALSEGANTSGIDEFYYEIEKAKHALRSSFSEKK